jgi:hypothetical protein
MQTAAQGLRIIAGSGLFLAALLFSTISTGCVFDSDDDGGGNGSDSLRSIVGRVYTDHEFGYTVTLPEGWKSQANDQKILDLVAFNPKRSQTGTVSAHHLLPAPDSSVTLTEEVTSLYEAYTSVDSAHILPPELRNGVEIVAVEAWLSYPEDDPPYDHRREHVFHFVRGGRLIILTLSDTPDHFEANTDLKSVGESLTFF